MNVIVVGGGAAGFFTAAVASAHPNCKVTILEKTMQVLSKVKISGGGRCNVTHACFEKEKLVLNYPRGNPELIGPFSRFGPAQTIGWFSERNVALKIESDGRAFPVSDSSQTIIDCLTKEVKQNGVQLALGQKIETITKNEHFHVQLSSGEVLTADALVLATGSSAQGHNFAKHFGHTIVSPVPSLFTFHVPSSPLLDLSGIAVQDAQMRLKDTTLSAEGPLLITHFGFSGPALLRLSAFAARAMHEKDYHVTLEVNWLPNSEMPTQSLEKVSAWKQLPRQLWKRLLALAGIGPTKTWAHLSKQERAELHKLVHAQEFLVEGKSLYKEEFVTAGGVALKEINFKTMESRLVPRLFFAGEILDIDGVTGGFNFQNAWTSGYLAGTALGSLAT